MNTKIEDLKSFEELMDEYILTIANSWDKTSYEKSDRGVMAVDFSNNVTGEYLRMRFILTYADQVDVLNYIKKTWMDEQQDPVPFYSSQEAFLRDVIPDVLNRYRTTQK